MNLPKRPSIGDILEIPTSKGFAYAQYVNYYSEFPRYGPLLRVFTRLHSARPSSINSAVEFGDNYYVFFPPVAAAVRRCLISVVGHQQIPPKLRVRPTFRSYNTNINGEKTSLFVIDDDGEHRVKQWTPDQIVLSLKRIATFTTLVEDLEAGWHPRQDR